MYRYEVYVSSTVQADGLNLYKGHILPWVRHGRVLGSGTRQILDMDSSGSQEVGQVYHLDKHVVHLYPW